ncbi:unnamed protein product [Prunus brigantina]
MVLLLLHCLLYRHTNHFKHSKNRHFIPQSVNDRYDLGMEVLIGLHRVEAW